MNLRQMFIFNSMPIDVDDYRYLSYIVNHNSHTNFNVLHVKKPASDIHKSNTNACAIVNYFAHDSRPRTIL